MPEIAEVALMANSIRQILNGKRLNKISVLGGRYKPYHIQDTKGEWINKIKNEKTGRLISISPKDHPNGRYCVDLPNLDEFNREIPLIDEQPVIHTNGKFCHITIGGEWYIAITFGMSGTILYEPSPETDPIKRQEYLKNAHIKFETADGLCFYFGDVRRFGTIILSKDHSKLEKKLNHLGPDMLTGPPISNEKFIEIFRRPKFNNENICKVLMSQEAVSGVGNYIKAEVLYECRIHPLANVRDINDETLIELNKAIREIAKTAYQEKGASLYTYVGSNKEKGSFQDYLKVYNKSHDPLGNPIKIIAEKDSPDHRTTHYCEKIQIGGIPPKTPL